MFVFRTDGRWYSKREIGIFPSLCLEVNAIFLTFANLTVLSLRLINKSKVAVMFGALVFIAIVFSVLHYMCGGKF
jgi:hypothetical protein